MKPLLFCESVHTMNLISHLHSLRAFLITLCLGLCLSPCLAWGDDDGGTLDLYSAYQESSSTASRAPKPLSQTAENVTVVTAKEIEAINAHTLADVLDTIPGIQTQRNGGPGGLTYTYIQSASPFHSLMMIDGSPLNNANNTGDVGIIPARIIERIEIVKGAASSSWGQALGGVINVITKTPERNRIFSGTADASIGERTTVGTGATLSGSNGPLGYLLSGGWLGSNGLLPNSQVYSNYIFSKLDYKLPEKGTLTGTFRYSRADRGVLYVPLYDFMEDYDSHNLQATLQLQRPLTDQLELEVKGHYIDRDYDRADYLISDNSLFDLARSQEHTRGVSAKLIWRGENSLLVVGSEYEHEEFKAANRLDPSNPFGNYDTKYDRYGVYLNDTITVGPVSVTPGARFDSTASGDQFSPSIGATWQVTDNILLRGYTGRGFSFPVRITGWEAAKIWSSQIGVESSALPYIWLKGTLFRNETWNIKDQNNLDPSIYERRMALGSELEARTVPVWNTSLGAAWTYTDTHRTKDDSIVYGLARHTVQLALRYDDQKYRGALTGRHIMWDSTPGYNGRDGGLIWDLHLGATLLKKQDRSLELFFSGHNLFNGDQYSDVLIPNTGRWFEGGMRVRF